jgi:hypothetical protein
MSAETLALSQGQRDRECEAWWRTCASGFAWPHRPWVNPATKQFQRSCATVGVFGYRHPRTQDAPGPSGAVFGAPDPGRFEGHAVVGPFPLWFCVASFLAPGLTWSPGVGLAEVVWVTWRKHPVLKPQTSARTIRAGRSWCHQSRWPMAASRWRSTGCCRACPWELQ